MKTSPPRASPSVSRATAGAAAVLEGGGIGLTLALAPGTVGALLVVGAIVVGLLMGWRLPPRFVVLAGGGALFAVSAVAGAAFSSHALEGAVTTVVEAVVLSVALALPALLIASVRQRRSELRSGWDLARALAREEDARVESAVMRERAEMAGEIHDGLGHRLTLIAVQLGRLTLDGSIPPQAREELDAIRSHAATASDELGATVRLLRSGAGSVPAPAAATPTELVQQARNAGMAIEVDLPESFARSASDYARSAVARAIQEALTNAAKHAPGETVRIAGGRDGDRIVLEVRNRNPERAHVASSTGHGLVALRHRMGVLGGSVAVEQNDDFVLTVTVPVDAAPSSREVSQGPSREDIVMEELTSSGRKTRRAVKLAWAVPAGLAGAALAIVIGYFTYANITAVVSPQDFARIQVGMSKSEAERHLPPVQMLDAPRTVLQEPAGATCQYYEATVSFFARDDVYRICVADGTVRSKDVILAP